MVKNTLLLFITLHILFPMGRPLCAQDSVHHPFLLVEEQQFDLLRALTDRSPWRESYLHAMEDFENLVYDPAMENFGDKATSLRDMISAATLCYLLDTIGTQRYLDSLDQYLGFLDDIYETRKNPPDNWDSNVPVASVAFNAILCLDITHARMAPDRRAAHEQRIARLVEENHGWYLSEYALRGLWALYLGDSGKAKHYIDLYDRRLESLVTPNGIFNGGTGYSTSRFVKDQREHKFCFMDVIQFQGLGNYYDQPRYQNLYEWIFCHNFTTYGSVLTFGDAKRGTSARKKLYESPAAYRAGRFSEKASGWASWHVKDTLPQGRLLIYLLMQEPVDPVRPDESHIYRDGGAFFLSNPDHREMFSATLWNCRSESSHAHTEVNALGLAAYGEDLMVNSGYNNWGNGKYGFSWSYIHDQAISGNTALINGLDHRSKSGNGILRGFIDPSLSYARGDAGEALTGGIHERSLLFVPGDSIRNGYAVVFDAIRADIPYSFVNLAFHPAAEEVGIIEENRQYRWEIHRWSETPVSLDIHLTTPARSVSIKEGLLADKSYSIIGKYLYPDFMTDASGRASIATILFPHDEKHSLPAMSDHSYGALQATRIRHSDELQDIVLSSESDSLLSGEGVMFIGESAFLRMEGDTVRSLFAENAIHLKNCHGRFTGFSSDHPITLYLTRGKGSLFLHETSVIDFYYPGIEEISLDNRVAETVFRAENRWKIQVDAGRYDLDISYTLPDSVIDPHPCRVDTPTVGRMNTPVFHERKNWIEVSPNPVREVAYISLKGSWSGSATLEVIDLTGSVVLSMNIRLRADGEQPDFRLNCSSLEPGIYLLRVTRGSDEEFPSVARLLRIN